VRTILPGIKFALSYFTILPVRFRESDDFSRPGVLRVMMMSLPFIGMLLAGLSIGVFVAVEPLGWLAALLASLIYMVLYGFIHTEAVIDVADAVYAAHSGKDPYAVIKEPTVGAMGVLYGVSFVILKIAALSVLLMHHLFLPFVAVAAISRVTLLILIRTHEFRSSFVSQLRESFHFGSLTFIIAVVGTAGFFALSWPFAFLFFLGTLSALFLSFLTKRSLGFVNGDVLGMSLEGVELILIFAVLLTWF